MFLVLCIFLTSCVQKSDQVCFGHKCIQVEVVEKAEDLMRGLQFRPSLEKNSGMLFVFPRSDIYKFWMKDTWIPLDMIWLDEEKKVVEIVPDVPPCQEEPCPSYGSPFFSRYVLEVNAGHAKELGIKNGDKAIFKWTTH